MSAIDVETDRLDREIGDRLRRARKLRGLTQGELGVALGVTFQQIQKYERGVNRVSTSALVLIARALEVSPLEIMGMAETQTSESNWDLLAAEGSERLLRHYQTINSPKLRQVVVDVAKRLAEADHD
jgi:transcriptional regulator with XRE-family HTH domain